MYGPELARWIDEHLAEPQVLVMGRVTYELLSPRVPPETGAHASRIDELPKVVLSRTLREPLAWPNARVVAGDLATVLLVIAVEPRRLAFDPARVLDLPAVVPGAVLVGRAAVR